MSNVSEISAFDEPEKATERAKELLEDTEDEDLAITLPPDGLVELPGGYLDMHGRLHQDAVVRELTGGDEETLFKPENTRNPARFVRVLLQRGVERVGAYENPDQNVLGALLIGDRDMLMLAIRRATYGDKLEMKVTCPACSNDFEVEVDLEKDINVRRMEKSEERSFEMTLRHGQKVVVFLAVGSDQEALMTATNKTLPELNSIVLARCVMGQDDRPLGLDGVRALGALDRRNIIEEMTTRQPGPQYTSIDLDCPICERKFPLGLTVADLFR